MSPLILAVLLLSGPPAAPHAAPEHPHQPWVFRSVLDGRARMITVALDRELWLAYDATDGSLYRAWNGGVHFDGAVYTTVHGPQPTSHGALYVQTDGLRWVLERDGQELEAEPHHAGYSVDGADTFRLLTRLRFPDGSEALVSESPRARVEGDTLRLDLRLAIEQGSGLAGARLRREWTHRGPGAPGPEAEDAPSPPERTTSLLTEGPPTVLALSFPIVEPPAEDAQEPAPGPEAEPEPQRGVAPGEIPVERLDDGFEAFGPRERGVSLRVYDVGVALDAVPRLVDGQTPNVNAVVPRVELFGAASFGGLEDGFVTILRGFLETEAGTYALRLRSDDGSLLELDGALVIDNDGPHAQGEGVVAERSLAAGLHPFEIRHFEAGGEQSLLLEWRPPGAEGFTVVPDEAFSCPAGEVRVTSPGDKKVLVEGVGGPGDGRPLEGVHPALALSQARPASFEPKVGGLDWLSDGRLVVCTWEATGSVWVLDGVGGDPEAIDVRRIAWGLAEPLGLKVVDDRVYVLQKQELTELVDHDGDGVTDEYRCVCSGWEVTANFHEFAFGLVHQDGRFYANLAIAIQPGGKSSPNQVPDRGQTIRIDPRDGSYETVARGLRTPNGIGLGVGGAIFLTDNQGDWLPSSKLLRLVEGAFYESRAVLLEASADLPVTPPVCWLPQNEIGNSPSQPALIPDGWGPYAGQMLHGEVTHGGLKRDFVEELDGVWQGTVFRFTQGLEAGINRLSFGPDGALVVGGIGSTGNWGQEGKLHFGLQRLAYVGPPAFEMLAVRTRSNGFEVELTEPLGERWGHDPLAWRVEDWRYEPSEEYGGPKLDERSLPVKSVRRLDGGRRLFLELEGLAPGRVVHLRIVQPFTSASGRPLWSTECWTTLNRLPALAGEPLREDARNTLTPEERAAGWELLFDGRSLERWCGFHADTVPDGWQVRDGTIARVGPAGDLVTRERFGDFELAFEWRISHGGNSGVFFHVDDAFANVWESGPEMQVLDDAAHPDGASPLTSAGANYALHAPAYPAGAGPLPIGRFNQARLRVEGGHVEHWLNGAKVLEYELDSPDWRARVAASKFASLPGYGRSPEGRIALQDHGDPVAFRNLRIRRL